MLINFKKFLGIFSLSLAVSITPVYAQYEGPKSPPVNQLNPAEITSVASILATPMPGKKVFMKGKIIEQISSDKFKFSDGAGEIIVEIDKDYMPFEAFDENTTVLLFGEVKIKDRKKTLRVEVDVDRVEIAK